MHATQVSPERLAAAMRAERALAAGKTGRGLFARPEFPDRAACRLLEAAEGGNLQRVQECLAKGTAAATADLNGHTALHKCAFMGFESIAKLLIASDPGAVAARQPQPHQVHSRTLTSLSRPAPATGCVNASDLLRNVPLHAAAFSDNVSIARCPLPAPAPNPNPNPNPDPNPNPNPDPNPNPNPNQVSIARCLLAAKAEVDPKDAAGNTPLHRATLEGNHEVAELLLRHGCADTSKSSRVPCNPMWPMLQPYASMLQPYASMLQPHV